MQTDRDDPRPLISETGLFACPGCRGRLMGQDSRLRCAACGRDFPLREGIRDFCPQLGDSPGVSQRFMEAPAIASIYEGVFRPLFTRLGSSIRYGEEEAYLRRWCDPAPGLVIDLACGTGRYTRWLARHRAAGHTVIGLDLSAAMLAVARERSAVHGATGPVFARASAQSLPIRDGAAGAVNCFGALHLFPDPFGAIGEISRALRPGGCFTCLTACKVETGGKAAVQRIFGRATSFRFFEDREIEERLRADGFELRDLSRSGMVLLFAAGKK